MHDKKNSLLDLEDSFMEAFDQKALLHTWIHLVFALALLGQVILLALFFPFLVKNAIFAFALAFFVMTVFAFFLTRQYLGSQKYLSFKELSDRLVADAKECIGYKSGTLDHHLQISKLCSRLAEKLYLKEYNYYVLPSKFSFFSPVQEVISASLHWQEVEFMRQILLEAAVNEHLELVKIVPTNPDAHALLANAYIMLSGLFIDPRDLEKDQERFIPKGKYGPEKRVLFEETAKKAIEEFKILRDYSPNDPWIYNQLAYSYRDLKMIAEEKAAYETILSLRPNDYETLYKLGNLYFKQGENARGLKIYEDLKKVHYNKADELLTIYGRN